MSGKRICLFAKRNAKEILREPLNLCFGLGFPLVLLVLLSIIDRAIPPEANNTMFSIENLAPGLAVFGTAFMALFAGMLLAKDRTSSFLTRLFASPMRAGDFIFGYMLPLFVITMAQTAVTLLCSLCFGLAFTAWIFPAILVSALTGLLFVGIGLLCGSVLSDKAVGGVCGALVTNLAGWLSGVFIPLELIGGGFLAVCKALPFYQAVAAVKAALSGDFAGIFLPLGIVLLYAAGIYLLAVWAFLRQMKKR